MLACTLMTESHTGVYLATLLDDTLHKFNITSKVVRCTTDNARNFVASFQKFGHHSVARTATLTIDDDLIETDFLDMRQTQEDSQDEVLPRASIFKVNEVEDALYNQEEQEGSENREEQEGFFSIDDVLHPDEVGDGGRGGRPNLPAHSRCAAHTLNLIGRAGQLLKIFIFKKLKITIIANSVKKGAMFTLVSSIC